MKTRPRGLGLQLINEDAAAEEAHHFAKILGRLWLAPLADFGVAKTIEGMNEEFIRLYLDESDENEVQE